MTVAEPPAGRAVVLLSVADHLAALDDAGRRLASAARTAGLNAAVPTCEGWMVRDLLHHIGGVHRWCTAIVGGARSEPPGAEESAAFFAGAPDPDLLDWYDDGLVQLRRVLAGADPDVACWSFLPAPSPLAFWARRQAHETAVHGADAESCVGEPTPLAAGFAVDGLDELLGGMVVRRMRRLVADPPVTLGVRPTDAAACWTVRIGPDGRNVTSDPAPADCVVSGPASDLYLLLWNRGRPGGAVEVDGDGAVLDFWRRQVTIRRGEPPRQGTSA